MKIKQNLKKVFMTNYSLTELVNSQYSVDETWYYIDAYIEPSKYDVMRDIFTGRAYKQDYKIRKD